VNVFTLLLCLCLRPSLVKSCPLIKVLPLSSFRLVTHTHMKQTDERSRCLRPSGSHGICGMPLFFPANSPVFVFFHQVSSKACVCVCSSAPHTPRVGLSSACSRFCLIGQQTETGRLERQYPASAAWTVCHSSPKGNKEKLCTSTSKPTQRRRLLL